MGTKKLFLIAMLGFACAAAVCLIVGMCFYFPAVGTTIDATNANYTQLVAERAASMRLGLLIMVVGGTGFIFSAMGFLAIFIFSKLKKYQQIHNNDNQNITE